MSPSDLDRGDAPADRPRHVAIIMDGNGRWARERGLPRTDGHRAGARAVRETVRAARELGLGALTLYAFSSQNWRRPTDEVWALMVLLRDYLLGERAELLEHDIRLRAIGQLDRLPAAVREPLDALVADTARCAGMTLTLALSYSSRAEIVDAARAALRAALAEGEPRLVPAQLDEARFAALLPTHDLPPLDLLIRTSGEQRLSDFLLWEAAYAELHFTEKHWPEFRRADLEAALEAYGRRERRFGRTSEQLRTPSPRA